MQITRDAINLIALLSRLFAHRVQRFQDFDFDGFAGGETTVELQPGWRVRTVYLDGNKQRRGTGNDYAVSTVLDRDTITFSTPLTATDWVSVDAIQEVPL